MSPKIISLEGNIGAGKSTFALLLKEKFPEYKIILEPVDSWTNIKDKNNKNLLQYFYEDKNRWAYTFQNYAYITRIRQMLISIKNLKDDDIIITERSIWTDKNIFAKMLYDDGSLSELEWQCYNTWFDFFNENIKLSAIIYINTDPKINYERIQIRNRISENNIPMDYLENLNRYHDEWILNENIPKCICDGNLDFKHNKDILENMFKQIMELISKL